MIKKMTHVCKVLCISALILFVFEATADQNSVQRLDDQATWSQILTSNLVVKAPQVWFGGNAVGLMATCRSNVNIYSQYPIQVCSEYKLIKGEQVCNGYQSKYLYRPIKTTSQVCKRYAAQHECVEWKMETQSFPTSYMIPVYDKVYGNHQGLLFTKEYEIPFCVNL